MSGEHRVNVGNGHRLLRESKVQKPPRALDLT